MSDNIETVGNVEDLHQQEPESFEIKSVPVTVEGPIKTQHLPSRAGVMRSFTATATAQLMLGEDPRRRKVIIMSVDQPVYIGLNSNEVSNGAAALWPDNVPLEITHYNQVWVAVAQTSGTSIISVVTELWAD